MKRMNIGGAGLWASAIGVGCMRITGLTAAELSGLVDVSLEELGIDLFDHADIYGGGESESMFGRLLADRPSLRDKLVLQSKCGVREGWYDLSREHIIQSVDRILARLHTDYLDLFILHRPDALMEPDEIAEAFGSLQACGKVRYFGVSNMNPAQIHLLSTAVRQRLIVNQVQFSVARTGIIDSGINVNVPDPSGAGRDAGVLDYCRARGITLQAWSPLQYGFFEGTFIGNERYPELNGALERLAEKYGCDPAAIAIAWILRHPAGIQAIVGTSKPQRLRQMAKAGDIVLKRREWYEVYRAAGNQLP